MPEKRSLPSPSLPRPLQLERLGGRGGSINAAAAVHRAHCVVRLAPGLAPAGRVHGRRQPSVGVQPLLLGPRDHGVALEPVGILVCREHHEHTLGVVLVHLLHALLPHLPVAAEVHPQHHLARPSLPRLLRLLLAEPERHPGHRLQLLLLPGLHLGGQCAQLLAQPVLVHHGDGQRVQGLGEPLAGLEQRLPLQLGRRLQLGLESAAAVPSLLRRPARDRNHAPDALGDARLLHQLEEGRLAGVGQVRAPAELNAEPVPLGVQRVGQQLAHGGAHADHAHRVRVPLAEHPAQRGDLAGLLERRDLRVHRQLLGDLLVHNGLHARQLLGLQRPVPGEVEPQPLGVHGAALLVAGARAVVRHPAQQHLAQREVQHVRHGVVGRHPRAPRVVHPHPHGRAHGQAPPAGHLAHVKVVPRERLAVAHLERLARLPEGDRPRVEDLPAGLRVERRAVQQHAHGAVCGRGAVHKARAAVVHLGLLEDGHHHGRQPRALLGAEVLGGRVGGRHAVVGQPGGLLGLQHQVGPTATLGGRVRLLTLLTLLLHFGLKALRVQREALLLGHEGGQIHREAHGGIQELRSVSREDSLALGLHLLGDLVELAQALVERLVEGLLLLLDDVHDEGLAALQLGEGALHEPHHHGHQLVEEAGRAAQHLLAIAHAAAEHTPEHVAAAVRGGHGAVRDGEGQRADVVGHHPVGHVHVVRVLGLDLARVVAGARHLLDGAEDGLEDVRVVVGGLALQDGGQPLEAHARVHVLVGQLAQHAALLAVELNEHVVPDLDHVRQVGVHQRRGVPAADAVVVDLRAGPAGAGVAHLPEVVLAPKGQHALRGQELQPDLACLLIRLQPLGLVAAEVGCV
mmetsp:Transcript_37815/g.65613  ORF Transcript_37815/g.65613 Transcript_37815/m.65613 type:complete len:854 (-) Transcript_37815:547-3108(-)